MKKNNDMILDDKTLITTWAAGNGENRELVCSLQVPTTFPHFPLSFHFPRYLQQHCHLTFTLTPPSYPISCFW